MNLVKASYEILTPISEAGICELKHIESIGRVCYKSEDRISEDSSSAIDFVKKLIEREHEAMLEHSSLAVKFIVDRGVSHELVRHRIASFAQESTRYCNYSKDKFGDGVTFVIPMWLQAEEGVYSPTWDGCIGCHNVDPFVSGSAESYWFWHCAVAERDYLKLLEKGWTPQQARSVLPNSTKTEIIITANYREWRNFFKLRTAPAAHPQMREVTIPLLVDLKHMLPVIFDDIEAKL